MTKRGQILGATAAAVIAAGIVYSTSNYSLQQALNLLATNSAGTTYSTQEALNILARGRTDSLTMYSSQQAANRIASLGVKRTIGQKAGYRPVNLRIDNFATAADSHSISIGARTSREFFARAHDSRIRQTGTIYKVKFPFGSFGPGGADDIDSVQIRLWRWNGTTYRCIGTTGEIKSLITANSLNTLTLATPITGVRMGDYYSIRLCSITGVNPGTNQVVFTTHGAGTTANTMTVQNSAPTTTINWDTQILTDTDDIPQIQFFMPSPQIVGFGASTIAGRGTGHYDFIESRQVSADHSSTTLDSTQLMETIGALTGASYQVMGIGGEVATASRTRVTRDLTGLFPSVAVIHIGGNDINATNAISIPYQLVSDLIDTCSVRNITPIIMGIGAWTAVTDAEADSTENLNARLSGLCQRRNVIFVPMDGINGQIHHPGPVGNLWDTKTSYDQGDGIHFRGKGQERMAKAIVRAYNQGWVTQ